MVIVDLVVDGDSVVEEGIVDADDPFLNVFDVGTDKQTLTENTKIIPKKIFIFAQYSKTIF